MIKKLLIFLTFCASAFGQSTTTVTGNLKNLGTGTVSTGSFVRFYLRGCAGNLPRINGTAIIAPTLGNVYYFDFVPNSSGAISGSLYSTRDATGNGNGAIECGGSLTAVWYGYVPFLNGKAGPETPVHAKASATLDISNITPITVQPVVTAPTGDLTYLRLDGGNSPLTGAISLASDKLFNTGQCVVTGNDTVTDLGTQVNNCIALLQAAPIGGEVIIHPNASAGQWVYSVTIAPDRPVHIRGAGVGGESNVGIKLAYSGTGKGIDMTNANLSGSILENFSLRNTGTGTVGIDIDTGNYNIKIRDVVMRVNTAWSVAAVRIGNSTVGGQVQDANLDHFYCEFEATCVLSLRNVGLNITNSGMIQCTGTTGCLQIGDATHVSSNVVVTGGIYNGNANGTAITVLNSTGVSFFSPEGEIDGTGYMVDAPSTATSCGNITYIGGRINTASFSNVQQFIFDNNKGGCHWVIMGVEIIGLTSGKTIFREQTAPAYAFVSGNVTDQSGTLETSAYTNFVTMGNNLGGTLTDAVLGQSGNSTNTGLRFSSSNANTGWVAQGVGAWQFYAVGNDVLSISNRALSLDSVAPVQWSAGDSFVNGPDSGFSRLSAGVIGLGNGTQGSVTGTLQLSALKMTNLLISVTAPTIAAAGCGGSAAAMTANNGTGAFEVNVGTAPTSGGCTITMPSATTGWNCDCSDLTTTSTTVFYCKQTGAVSQTSVVLQNFSDVAAATAFNASDHLRVKCAAY